MFVVCEAVVAGMNVGVGARFGKFSKYCVLYLPLRGFGRSEKGGNFYSFVSASVLCEKEEKKNSMPERTFKIPATSASFEKRR